MKSMPHFSAALAVLTLLSCAAEQPAASPIAGTTEQGDAQTPAVASDEQSTPAQDDGTPGLSVGAKAPAFELKDQEGESRSLAGLLEEGSTALVFYRSADW